MTELFYMGVAEFWGTLLEMSPYLLFGFAVAGLLSVVVRAEQVEKHLGGRGLFSILKASLFGIPLPLCSCGVIPVAASLRRHGASKGAVASFLLSTPQTGVDSIMVTYSLMGPLFAIFRPIAALISGIVGGLLVELVGGDRDSEVAAPELCKDDCCSMAGREKNWFMRAVTYGFVTLPRDVGKSMIAGLVIAGLIAVMVPDDFFTDYIGAGLGGMFFMMLIGVPVYVCATASVPIAVAMMAKGISPGAALVFLITGPATNAAAITTIWKVLGRRSALAYLVSVAGVALLSGIALDYLFGAVSLGSGYVPHEMLPVWLKVGSALVLTGVLGQAFFKPSHKHDRHLDAAREFNVVGMNCSQCSGTVERVIREVPGVDEASVSLDTGIAEVKGTAACGDIIKAIESVGYSAEERGDGHSHG